jgi:hypothetical protein|tara:strand:- start:1850 stop:2032 length:183 start_codon:yes stop_codon:yes gene_type:complete
VTAGIGFIQCQLEYLNKINMNIVVLKDHSRPADFSALAGGMKQIPVTSVARNKRRKDLKT